MSFVKGKYYRPLCQMLFMQINSGLGIDKEVLRRDLASRIYYTGFLHCANTLELLDPTKGGEGSHNEVIKALDKEYLHDMVNLKKFRKDADYNMAAFPDPLKIKGQEVRLQRLLAMVDNILTKDKLALSA